VGALEASIATVTIPSGLRGSPITIVQDTQQVIGPFPTATTVNVNATKGAIEYVVGATPVLTSQLFNPNATVSIALNSATGTTLTAPLIQAVNSINSFTQVATQNMSAGSTASADFIAYPNNNTNDLTGFVDIGMCSSGFSDAAYTVTVANDAYLYGSAPSGASQQGNLVIATDSTGSSNAIQFYTGGFNQAKTAYAMQIDGLKNFYIKPPATPPTLANNGDVVFNLTSNTNLRISARGSDGVTRVANIVLI
jgi:hypothetical protein